MLSQIEQISDWCWEHKSRFCGVLGALALVGFVGETFYDIGRKVVSDAPELLQDYDDYYVDVR